MENEKDIYLADWLADKISDDQLKQLVGDEDFIAYKKIRIALQGYGISDPDMEKDFEAIQQLLRAKKETKTKTRIIPLWAYSVAASLVLFFGLYQVYFVTNEVSTDVGDSKEIHLSDNSVVTLNSKSKVTYPNLFRFNRTIQLEGEAYFDVQKGEKFTVETALGKVSVLGTEFNVTSFSNYFEVTCYEGKVSVETHKQTVILTPGESVRLYDDTFENWAETTDKKPEWISGESTFKNVPIKYVIAKFKNQYDVEIKFPKSIENSKFTGSFTHSNIETALKTICIPLNLNYSDSNSKTIQISE
ncbi:FecR family protein [Flavobacterium sp.]|uniref:FecR family protein n=1 Tax=Flavobacterium sp. TaxID=239 RepID=UPI002B4AF1B0|nr:FecR family protein [Flavobacterium sp.]HLP63727.1 FecR family protein [Flavobacterium sp.]